MKKPPSLLIKSVRLAGMAGWPVSTQDIYETHPVLYISIFPFPHRGQTGWGIAMTTRTRRTDNERLYLLQDCGGPDSREETL
jgi:hypothetical protein